MNRSWNRQNRILLRDDMLVESFVTHESGRVDELRWVVGFGIVLMWLSR